MPGRPRRISIAERRARLARRHHLAPAFRATSPVDVARDLVALHSSDPKTVFLSLWARLRAPDVAAIERALYEGRTLLRLLGMRRTLFVVPVELAPLLQDGFAAAIARTERRRLTKFLEGAGVAGDVPRWLRQAEAAALRAVIEGGEVSGAEVTKADPRLATKIVLAQGKRYEATVSVSTRALILLAMQGKIVRGRPLGSWISSQYRWSATDHWIPGGLPRMSPEEAQAEMIRRWLGAFGPGTLTDLRWWTGLTAREVHRALSAIRPVEVELEDGGAGFVLRDDVGAVRGPQPWVALLPGLDPTVMGWAERGWYLGDHGKALFDTSGNAGPTVWLNGRVVGLWSRRSTGEVVFRLLEDVGAEAVRMVEAEAARLQGWLGDVSIVPRFRTPLERELSG